MVELSAYGDAYLAICIYYSIVMMMTEYEYDMSKDGYGKKDMYNDEYLTGSTA